MHLIDTNIFLEILLNQKKAEDCEKFLQKVSSGELQCIVSSFTVHAVEGILSENLAILETFLKNINNSIGLTIHTTTIGEELAISIVAQKIGLDFDDSLQYLTAKKTGAETIISFDGHFDKTDLRRKEPIEVI
ncbi:MAG: type II toxin-antitoxin system VapC family toxin [Candidatus Aenigmarchaeota archaeon]|nr:type II toxin-antitoxin system VapC family toxin [Candidatus Aenigmarchaeota archaeon]